MIDKEKLIEWLNHMIKAMKKSKNEQKETSYTLMLREVESGFFDKEVTPCENATTATIE
jgi:hypothetical protein